MMTTRRRYVEAATLVTVLSLVSLVHNLQWMPYTFRSLLILSSSSSSLGNNNNNNNNNITTKNYNKSSSNSTTNHIPDLLIQFKNQIDPIDYNTSFSACLLWMDDNFRLPEWISYHYYMMNLRYLVIAIDPKSRTSPSTVLQPWKHLMTIEEWIHSSNYTDIDFEQLIQERISREQGSLDPKDLIRLRSNNYVFRQVEFFQSCAMHLKKMNRTWTAFHDFDEYIVVPKIRANVSYQDLKQPGIIPRIIQQYYVPTMNVSHVDPNRDIDTFRNWSLWFSLRPCFNIPRAMFSAINSSDDDVSRHVPHFLDARRFDTFNWRYQGTHPTTSDGPGKTIIDVSRLPDNARSVAREQGDGTPHKPFPQQCTHAWATASSLPLVIHHYLGSWEAFSYRDDVRKGGGKTIHQWLERSTWQAGGINDDARVWISGFVNMVGEEVAKELLRDAGLPRDYLVPDNETALWVPIELLLNQSRNLNASNDPQSH